ncbi:alanyl-tRNA editing protein [Methylocapsa sp. S129]|uniref:alanyl-tRNA editing protein n=1 Tax=Methylocapsa sp. S129 TaxID=1641869 RepID=UPI00131B7926|nr:alanyl-tRNA editing protein [Methylocapsa sp. S129]
MTEPLFRADSYLKEIEGVVVSAEPRGIVLEATHFYAQGGGQAGDQGEMLLADGSSLAIVNAIYDADKRTILHVPAAGAKLPAPGEKVTARLNWDLRLKRMRAHTALHLLTAVLPYPVTGGAVGDGEGRLDFDSGDAALDKAEIAQKLNALIATNAAVGTRWITDEELAANPGLVKTMSVKPPTGSGRVRLVEIEGIDLQPCGGTHVARTGEIGHAEVTQVEKKGRINRRVRIVLTQTGP